MNITFKKAIEEYLIFVEIKNKQTSYRNIKNRLSIHILPYFENKNVFDLSSFDYLNWQIDITKKGYSYKYKSTLHTCFVTFLNFCVKFYGLSDNVASKVGNFKNDQIEKKGNVWTIDEFNNFIVNVDDLIYSTLFEFLYFTGCRVGEALALTFNDFENEIITICKTTTRFYNEKERIITTPKTRKSIRNISIDNNMINKINLLYNYYKNTYINFNDNFYIFGGLKTLALTTITRKKDYYCKKSNVKKIKIHEFRHSHACLLFQNNVPIEEISQRLGHANISMTIDVYLKNIPKNEKRTLGVLNSLHQ